MEYGYYEVAGKRYINKLRAVIDAVPLGHWPHWNFYDSDFSKVSWTQEPQNSLESLYFQRARYLRENYDYIAIEFSGGADSWNVVYSFLKQGLHVDALIHKYVDVGLTDDSDLSSSNQASEGRFQAWPWFQRFQELSTDLKWHTYYAADQTIAGWHHAPLDLLQTNRTSVNIIVKTPGPGMLDYKFIPPNKKSALVYGTDKPNIIFENNNFYLYFCDDPVNTRAVNERHESGTVPYRDIFFYWDPNCAAILSKQAHLVMNWFRRHPECMYMINSRQHQNRNLYHQIVNALIYPRYKKIWQSDKSTGKNIMSHDAWFHSKNPDNSAVDNWRKSLTASSDMIKNVTANTQFESWVEYEYNQNKMYACLPDSWSQMYLLGGSV